MTVAVLADIHANNVAFERCVDDAVAAGADAFWLLGDYVGDFAGVRETMALIRELRERYPCVLIRGNKEDYWLGDEASRRNWRYGSDATGTLLYSYNMLTDADREMFGGLPLALKIGGDCPVVVCHGRPDSNRRAMKDNDETRAIMERAGAPYIICGHMHERFVLEHNGVKLINVGSVGVSISSPGKAEYLLMRSDGKDRQFEPRTLDYDTDRAISDLYKNGLGDISPCWTRSTAALLKYGRPKKTEVVSAVIEICKQRYGELDYSEIPRDCWLDALAALGVE